MSREEGGRRGRGDGDREGESPWNRQEKFHNAGEGGEGEGEEGDRLDDAIRHELHRDRPQKRLSAKFLNMPGGRGQPRSLYGLDWDLGDLVNASFAGTLYTARINVVYVTIREDGTEDVNARTGQPGDPSSALST